MDTPEKSAQISTPLSKFEDSPVFNYISSLSPIKPVRSIHIAQTFHSLSFSSLPSVFTSPHVSSHKESRFLRRNCYSDASRLELPSGTGTKVCSDEGLVVDVGHLFDNSADAHGNFNNAVSTGQGSVEQSSEHLKYEIEHPQILKYDCSNPETDQTRCCGIQMDCASELAGTSISLDPFLEEVSQRISHEGEVNLPETCQIEQKQDVSECDWESLISDAADLLIFNSPVVTEGLKGLMQHSLDRAVRFCTSLNDVEKMQPINHISSVEQHEMGDPSSTQPGETIVKQDVAANDNSQLEYMISNSSGQVGTELETSITVDSKAVSNLHRGLRRRCLDFEMVGTRRKNSDSGSTSSSSTQVQSEAKNMSKDGQLVLANSGSDSSKRILPGIGLHLNALAIASRDSKNKKRETAPSARTFPTTTASLPSTKTAQEYNGSLALIPAKTEMDPTESDVLLDEDVSQASGHLVSEDPNHSPKKKRRRVEGDIEGCKRCNCKKSKCLKLYCECFAAGVYCIEPCSCQECFNKPIHEDTVLATRKQIESRNPLAFAPKVIRNSESAPEVGEEPSKTPASARHKRGCNCKKSNCLKKYCECYQGGVGCSINCRCEGCKNAFGRKDGSAVMENETETEAETEDDTEAREKNVLDRIPEKTEILNNEEQNPNSTLPATPLQFCRSLVQMPFFSKSKPPRSFLSIGSSSALYTSQKFGKPNILRPTATSTTRFEKQFQSVPDEDIPEVLRGDQSPSTVIKTSSPNGKRISPHIGSSPGQRSSRKLILQSIPSFPSLTPHH